MIGGGIIDHESVGLVRFRAKERKTWEIEVRRDESPASGYVLLGTVIELSGYRGFLAEPLGLGHGCTGAHATADDCVAALFALWMSLRARNRKEQ